MLPQSGLYRGLAALLALLVVTVTVVLVLALL